MKTITATIKPYKLDAVSVALENLGFTGYRVIEVKGYGRHKGKLEIYRGAEYVLSHMPKIDVIITVPDDKANEVVQAILKAASSGRSGDGRITVVPVEQFINIRTGKEEIFEDALAVAE